MTVNERAMATRQGGAIATEAPGNPWATHGLLKPYAAGEVVSRPRVDAIATISAGFRGQDGFPVVSRDGTIHVAPPAGQAPGLEEALKARGGKGLTIALVHNDPSEILQQRFAEYSKTRVLAQGDANQITVIHLRETGQKDKRGNPIMEPERETVLKAENPQRYAQLAEGMKVQTSMYFALAYWTADSPPRPRLYFPDGLGLYRLRFMSLNSAEAIRGALYHVASMNAGVVAGVPLELSIVYQDVAGPDGSRRNVPIWSLRLLPPETIQLEPNSVRAILSQGAEQARMLQIAAPQPETLELAEYEGPDVDLDEQRIVEGQVVTPSRRAVTVAADGGPILNPKAWRQAFMIPLKGTSLVDKASRSDFVSAITHGRYDSLTSFSEHASMREARELIAAAADRVNRERTEAERPSARPAAATEEARGRYQKLFGDDADEASDGLPTVQETAPKTVANVTAKVHDSALLAGAPAVSAEPQTLARPADGQPYTRAQWEGFYVAWAAKLAKSDTAQQPRNPADFPNGALKAEVLRIIAESDNLDQLFAQMEAEEIEADEDTADEGEPELVDAF